MENSNSISNYFTKFNIIIAVIIILFLILIYYFWIYDPLQGIEKFDNRKYLQGMWEGMPDFCESSGLNNMILYIGDKDGNTYKSYFIISDIENNGETGIMKNITLKFSNGYVYINDDNTELDDLLTTDVPLENILPKKLKVDIDYNKGQMRLYTENDDKTYAYLYKNTSI